MVKTTRRLKDFSHSMKKPDQKLSIEVLRSNKTSMLIFRLIVGLRTATNELTYFYTSLFSAFNNSPSEGGKINAG